MASNDEQFEANPFQTTLPGYPPEYTAGLLPKPEISDKIFAATGTPAYNWKELEQIKLDAPHPGTTWKPIDPAAMYVSCLSWVAYPYGIPIDDQPCPYYRQKLPTPEPVVEKVPTPPSSSSSEPEPEPEPEQTEPEPEPEPLEMPQEEFEPTPPPLPIEPEQMETRQIYGWVGQ